MREKDIAVGVRTDTSKIAIVERGLNAFVDSRIQCDVPEAVGECAMSIRIPCHSKTVHVEESISFGDFGFGRRFCMDFRIMGEEFWQVVFMNLFAEGMWRSDEHIFEERWLCGRDVCKPTTHAGRPR
jgi:hypothetical protein